MDELENNENNDNVEENQQNTPNLPEIDLENDPRIQEYVKGLKNKTTELLNKIKETKTNQPNNDIGLTAEEIKELKELKEQRKKDQEQKLKEENPDEHLKSKIQEVENQYKQLLEKERKNVEEKEKVLNEFKNKETFSKIEKEVLKRSSNEIRKLKDVEVEEQKEFIKEKFEFNEDGVLVSKDNKINDQGERYNIDNYFNDLAKRRPHLFDQIPSGSGVKSTTSTGVGLDKSKKLTIEEAAILLEKDEQKYNEYHKAGLLPF